ncbi:MAG: hypothetical protein K2P27_11115, partial [Lachnospiraceae bacterium]|nr:hypothetical protein [Lachnospiraceae bacterium]
GGSFDYSGCYLRTGSCGGFESGKKNTCLVDQAAEGCFWKVFFTYWSVCSLAWAQKTTLESRTSNFLLKCLPEKDTSRIIFSNIPRRKTVWQEKWLSYWTLADSIIS